MGYIEDLASCGIPDNSIDLVVSNCVINLSPFKEQVLSEVYRVLKPGGELYFSDVYANRRMPQRLREDPVLVGECLGGALYTEDFSRLMSKIGWPHFAVVVCDPIHIGDLVIETKVGFMSFESRTIRAIKTEGLEPSEEDYGQHATYIGGMPEMSRYFDFDKDTRFVRGKPLAISGNTARMLEASRYGRFFEISPRRAHRGAFDSKRAQLALEVRGGRKQLDLPLLEKSYERLGYLDFADRVGERSLLEADEKPSTMQTNITYACNLACRHCYLSCGPTNTERMEKTTMEACLHAFEAGGFSTMDITGGSPELHPDFEWFTRQSSQLGEVIVRTNATLYEDGTYDSLLDTYAEIGARVVVSLPFYNADDSDLQRGAGVFKRAIKSIRKLNDRGYGKDERLKLDLVYNVAGPFLPWPQEMIEQAYKVRLEQDEGVSFNNLLAFNNYALGRFANDLVEYGMLDDYLALLADNFNAMALTRLMCLDQVNVDVDGRLYDCEVNHVLGLPIQIEGRDATVEDIVSGCNLARLVRTNPICYSCTAGFGSSCGGSLL